MLCLSVLGACSHDLPQACPPCPCAATKGESPGEQTEGEARARSGAESDGVVQWTTPGAIPGVSPVVAGCKILPPDNPWNQDISKLPVDPALMDKSITSHMSLGTSIHLDFGTTKDRYGIPITSGPAAPPVPLTFDDGWPDESDRLPCRDKTKGDFCYPIPQDARIEGGDKAPAGDDRHILFLATNGAPDHCVLFETFNTHRKKDGFSVKAAAMFNLDSNRLHHEQWTSADAAGLPILPGLVRYEEVKAGEIKHALRFTLERTSNFYIYPATHAAGTHGMDRPPLGARVRLRASFDDSKFTGPAKILTTAMKRYGMILADNGGDWYVSGDENDGWGNMDDFIKQMKKVKGRDFEIVKTGDILKQE